MHILTTSADIRTSCLIVPYANYLSDEAPMDAIKTVQFLAKIQHLLPHCILERGMVQHLGVA
jgi:hypothetical protein